MCASKFGSKFWKNAHLGLSSPPLGSRRRRLRRHRGTISCLFCSSEGPGKRSPPQACHDNSHQHNTCSQLVMCKHRIFSFLFVPRPSFQKASSQAHFSPCPPMFSLSPCFVPFYPLQHCKLPFRHIGCFSFSHRDTRGGQATSASQLRAPFNFGRLSLFGGLILPACRAFPSAGFGLISFRFKMLSPVSPIKDLCTYSQPMPSDGPWPLISLTHKIPARLGTLPKDRYDAPFLHSTPCPLNCLQHLGSFYLAFILGFISYHNWASGPRSSYFYVFVPAPGIHPSFQFTPSAEGCVFFKLASLLNSCRHHSGLFTFFCFKVLYFAAVVRHRCLVGLDLLSTPAPWHLALFCSPRSNGPFPQLTILCISAEGHCFSSQLTSNIYAFSLVLPFSCLASFGITSGFNIRGSWGIARLVFVIFLGAPGDFRV